MLNLKIVSTVLFWGSRERTEDKQEENGVEKGKWSPANKRVIGGK